MYIWFGEFRVKDSEGLGFIPHSEVVFVLGVSAECVKGLLVNVGACIFLGCSFGVVAADILLNIGSQELVRSFLTFPNYHANETCIPTCPMAPITALKEASNPKPQTLNP